MSPYKQKSADDDFTGTSPSASPEKFSSPEKFNIKNNKVAIPSFLHGFDHLTEDDLEILACFEEEMHR